MSDSWPHRGCLVFYAMRLWYFQPNGPSCYLYREREHLGNYPLAAHHVRRTNVAPPTLDELETHHRELAARPPPRMVYPSWGEADEKREDIPTPLT